MCEKEYYFKLKNNNVCVLYIPTTNSKLEKFVKKQHSLWQLTGSSLGALRELVAVAGMGTNAGVLFGYFNKVSIYCVHILQYIQILNILFRRSYSAIYSDSEYFGS